MEEEEEEEEEEYTRLLRYYGYFTGCLTFEF
jgi:hypothetical protein